MLTATILAATLAAIPAGNFSVLMTIPAGRSGLTSPLLPS
jgi:hypothetical protein